MSSVAQADSVVIVTASAAAEIQHLLENPDHAGKHLRVYVEPGGCSGMQYGMTFDEKREGDFMLHGAMDQFEIGKIAAYGNGLYLPVRVTGDAGIKYRPAPK